MGATDQLRVSITHVHFDHDAGQPAERRELSGTVELPAPMSRTNAERYLTMLFASLKSEVLTKFYGEPEPEVVKHPSWAGHPAED